MPLLAPSRFPPIPPDMAALTSNFSAGPLVRLDKRTASSSSKIRRARASPSRKRTEKCFYNQLTVAARETTHS